MICRLVAIGVWGALTGSTIHTALAADPHNAILFIPDGLRGAMVNKQTAPTMAGLRDKGVNFKNSHALFPTFTMPNASAMATGHYLGDTGVFGNTIYTLLPALQGGPSVTPFLESDAVLGEVDAYFSGNFLNEETLFKAARDGGFSTAAIGKVGPALIFDHTNGASHLTIIVDDQTGTAGGIPLSGEVIDSMRTAGLSPAAPSRGENGRAGDAKNPGTTVANVGQQDYFADIATKVVLPLFKQRGRPFLLVFWSRDPDGSQHNQGDSLNQLTPGINGPTSLAAIRNADDDLAKLQTALGTGRSAVLTPLTSWRRSVPISKPGSWTMRPPATPMLVGRSPRFSV